MDSSKQCIVLSTQQDQQCTVSIVDLLTGTSLADFKQGGVAGERSVCLIGQDYLVAAEKDRPKLNIWHLNRRNAFHKKMIVPGVVNAMLVSPCSTFLLAAIATKLYVWQLASGNLISILERHYQDISVLRCSADGFYFVSGAADGQCLLWQFGDLFADYSSQVLHGASQGRNEPKCIWTDHQGRVTDVACGRYGQFGKCITASLDGTCKIYDVMEGRLLVSIVFDTPIWSIAMDLNEMHLYAGGQNGKLYETKLYRETGEIVTRIASSESVFTGHTDKVTSLSVSFDGNCLVSGSADCSIKKWHVPSKNCMVTYTYKAAVVNCFTMSTPTGLTFSRGTTDHFELLKRELITGQDAYDDGSITLRLPRRQLQLEEEAGATGGGSASGLLNDDTSNAERLKKELDELRQTNQQLYNYSLSKILNA